MTDTLEKSTLFHSSKSLLLNSSPSASGPAHQQTTQKLATLRFTIKSARNLSAGKNGTEYNVKILVEKESKTTACARGFNPEWNETFDFIVDTTHLNINSIINVQVEIFRKNYFLLKSIVAQTSLQVPIFFGELHEEDISMIGVDGNESCILSIAMELRIKSQQVSFEVGENVFDMELLDHRWLPPKSSSSPPSVPFVNDESQRKNYQYEKGSSSQVEDLIRQKNNGINGDSSHHFDHNHDPNHNQHCYNPSYFPSNFDSCSSASHLHSHDHSYPYSYSQSQSYSQSHSQYPSEFSFAESGQDFPADLDEISGIEESFDLEELRKWQEIELKCGKCEKVIENTEQLCVLECDHRFCCSCLREFADKNFFESGNSAKQLTCLMEGCPLTLPHWALRRSISEKEFESYLSLTLSSIVTQDNRYFSCPKCSVVVERIEANIPAVLKEEEFDGKKISVEAVQHKEEFRFRCRECSTEFCSSCGKSPYHLGFTCDSFNKYLSSRRCRFCQQSLSSPSPSSSSSSSSSERKMEDEVCESAECVEKCQYSCQKIMKCGHRCAGIIDEEDCIGCLNPSCIPEDSPVKGDDYCNICWIDGLEASPSIRLKCQHVFHFLCAKKKIVEGWPSARVTFSFWSCPLCKEKMDHPSLEKILQPFNILYDELCKKALKRLEFEGLNSSDDIVKPEGQFFNKPLAYALHRFAYYPCFKCKKPYFGGQVRCDAGDGGRDFNKEELVCSSCSDPQSLSRCPEHGTEYLEHKCQFCCSRAAWFCWGKTHFCDSCHKRQNDGDYVSKYSIDRLPKCSGPAECPLKIPHPPNGTSFCLGCALCRDLNDF